MKSALLKLFFCFLISVFFVSESYSAEKKPVEVCALFMQALLLGEGEAIDDLIVPNSYAYLLKDNNFLLPLKDSMEMLNYAEYRTLVPGDMILLRGDEKFEVTEDMVNENRAVIFITMLGEPLPFPFYIYKIDGSWKVDASPIVESRLIHYYQVQDKTTAN